MTTQDELAIRYEKEMKDSQQTADNKEQSSFSQTSEKSDKQWIMETHEQFPSIFPQDVRFMCGLKGIIFPRTLLDQLRRDAYSKGVRDGAGHTIDVCQDLVPKSCIQEAKKELLDEFENAILDMRPFENDRQSVITEIHKLRAKTLGEKN